MRIAVVAANGKAGKLIVKESLSRGHEVTAIVRSKNKSDAQKYISKDILSLEKADLTNFDVVIDAFGMSDPAKLNQHTKTSQHLCNLLANTDTRLVIIGGAGSLYVDKEHKTMLKDTPDFPDIFLPVANAQSDELANLRPRTDVNWTFISPAANFQAEGAKTGAYIQAGEEFTVNEKGESKISYADYAAAMLDEIEKGKHIKERISFLQA